MPVVTCKQCGKDFNKYACEIKKYPNHFCCNKCSSEFRVKNMQKQQLSESKIKCIITSKIKHDIDLKTKNMHKIQCKRCGILFDRYPSQIKNNNFCSSKCMRNYFNTLSK